MHGWPRSSRFDAQRCPRSAASLLASAVDLCSVPPGEGGWVKYLPSTLARDASYRASAAE
eukprot:3902833-Pleurochrysis_carterae.AAC.3